MRVMEFGALARSVIAVITTIEGNTQKQVRMMMMQARSSLERGEW